MDVAAEFARAQAAFQAGEPGAALPILRRLLPHVGAHPVVLHLTALCEARTGDAGADARFRQALTASGGDAEVHNNYGNFLKQNGRLDEALHQYDRALARNPALHLARRNRVGLLLQLGRAGDALVDAERMLASHSGDMAVQLNAGATYLALRRFDAAAKAFEAVLTMDPDHVKALHGRARVAAATADEAGALTIYRRAAALAPGDDEIALGLAEALEAAGEAEAAAPLEAAVARSLAWVAGQDALARMRAEAGAGDGFDAAYAQAVAVHPDDRALALGHAACLLRAARAAAGLAALDRWYARHAPDAETSAHEAMLALETGDEARAAAALARAKGAAGVEITAARLALRQGRADAAAALLEPVARARLGDVVAWAYLGLAWRLTGDTQHDWLVQPGLVGTRTLDVDLGPLADALRALHHGRAHPIGQSLRGGTQTRGQLFGRPSGPIAALEAAIEAAVAAHMADMPPADARHPLLRHRDTRLHFSGSWSVRLTGGGFHVAHVHPEGVLSSACYIVVPDCVDNPERPGWLEVGAPPAGLGLDLAPLKMIAPAPGRLALFPSTMFHGTRPFPAGERLTVAFDVHG